VVRPVICALAVAMVLPVPAITSARERTNQVLPAKRKRGERPPRPADLSLGGERRGGIELALGSITAVLAAVLIARGAWEVVNAQRAKKRCSEGVADPDCGIVLEPGRAAQIAAGLSFGFSVPIAIASGFLFRRGVRIRRDYLRFVANQKAIAVSPWGNAYGGGVSLRLRF
jgi:hypothetical protein